MMTTGQTTDTRARMPVEEDRETVALMAAHNMLTPLQVVLGNLELVLRRTGAVPDAGDAECLRQALGAAATLEALVGTMLDVYRLESRAMPVSRRPLELGPFLRRLAGEGLGPEARRRVGVGVTADCHRAFADPRLLEQVVMNLVSNALKYSPEDAPVRVGAERHGNGVRVWVRDFGRGIAPDQRERLFHKFGVLSGHGLPHGQSCGLGLAFCKLAVEAQGGEIGFDSPAGGGSLFWCLLPSAGAAPAGRDLRLVPCQAGGEARGLLT